MDPWAWFISFIVPWIGRAGGLTAIVGAVMFGIAMHENDPSGKQKAMYTVLGGAIIFAVGLAAPALLA
jgi:hypothetical protein